MTRSTRRTTGRLAALMIALAVALGVSGSGAPAFAAVSEGTSPPTDRAGDSCSDEAPRGGRLDNFAIDRLPAGVGEQVSDFSYEWEKVAFTSRVWESGPDDDGAYNVDASVKILRGDRLADLPALLDYLALYHERDAETWELAEFAHPDGTGYYGAGEAFWLVEPGVAVSVRVDTEQFSNPDLMLTVFGVHHLDD